VYQLDRQSGLGPLFVIYQSVFVELKRTHFTLNHLGSLYYEQSNEHPHMHIVI